MRIAYLINQYPKVSHSFIRREILALERQGFEIMRISLRGWDNDLVDDADSRRTRENQICLAKRLARARRSRPDQRISRTSSLRSSIRPCHSHEPEGGPPPALSI